nr:DNA repair protein RadC [uncultured Caldimonas sp.]
MCNVCSAADAVQANEDQVIARAMELLDQRLFRPGPMLGSPTDVRRYLKLKLADSANEVFAAVFLDAQNRVLAYEPLFQGSVDAVSVYPRVVLQRALAHNASALILCHNHPSGHAEPSRADRSITERLKEVLNYVDIRVLDHFIIGQGEPFSFAEAGLL